FSWLYHVASGFYDAPLQWIESFPVVFLPFFSEWYSDFFNSMALNLRNYITQYGLKGNVEQCSPLRYVEPLQNLNLDALPDLKKERDAVLKLTNTMSERMSQHTQMTYNGIDNLSD